MTAKQLKIFATSRKKETNHYIKPGSGIMTCYTSALLTTSTVIKRLDAKFVKTSPRLRIALIRGKKIKEVRHGEYGQTTPFNGNNEGKFRVGPPGYYTKTDNRPPYGERRQSLEELLAKHQEESARRSTEMEVWIKKT
ncbi:hypothetical protein Tco_0998642 [Tanacetum coccineum]